MIHGTMKKNNILVILTGVFVILPYVIFTTFSCRAQVTCYNICQKTTEITDCSGAVTKTVEFLNITCEQACPSDEHYRTVCPCTWEMWRKMTEIDCDGKTIYTEQKIDDFPCGTDPKPDENVTVPCVTPYGLSNFIKINAQYEIRQNNCVCDEFQDVHYQYLDMGCRYHGCRKIVTREFCDGSIVQDPPVYIEVPCPGICPPDELITDTICQYECGQITTYYDCDDPTIIDYVEPLQAFTYTYNCSNHDTPVCPPDEVFYEDCDFLKDIYKRKVIREYNLLRKDCTKAIRISTVYEMVN
jgi:hypothetical protein